MSCGSYKWVDWETLLCDWETPKKVSLYAAFLLFCCCDEKLMHANLSPSSTSTTMMWVLILKLAKGFIMKVTFFFTPTKVGFQFVDIGHVSWSEGLFVSTIFKEIIHFLLTVYVHHTPYLLQHSLAIVPLLSCKTSTRKSSWWERQAGLIFVLCDLGPNEMWMQARF